MRLSPETMCLELCCQCGQIFVRIDGELWLLDTGANIDAAEVANYFGIGHKYLKEFP